MEPTAPHVAPSVPRHVFVEFYDVQGHTRKLEYLLGEPEAVPYVY
jgi:hypothetical protein